MILMGVGARALWMLFSFLSYSICGNMNPTLPRHAYRLWMESDRVVSPSGQPHTSPLPRARSVVVGTPSAYRGAGYIDDLKGFGIHAHVASREDRIVEALRSLEPDVLVLEIVTGWEGARSVLEQRHRSTSLQSLPVILMARDGVGADSYQLAEYSIQGYFSRLPGARELADSIVRLAAGAGWDQSAKERERT